MELISFQSTFGGQGNPKLSSKRTVQFFMKFLTDLVPYEHAEYLKVSFTFNHRFLFPNIKFNKYQI